MEYHDISIYGYEESPGTALDLRNEDAVKNALVLWITSSKGDFLYSPESGGILKDLLFKPMSEASLDRLHFKIRNAINNRFSPSIKLLKLEIDPDYQNRFLKISILYKGVETKQAEKVVFFANSTFENVINDYSDIDYTEENLYNFCKVRKPSMGKEVLVYNNTEEAWVWGQYKLVNLTPYDSYFASILSICNID